MTWAILGLFAVVAWTFLGYGINPMAKTGFAPDKNFRRFIREVLSRVDTAGMNKDLLAAVFDLETGGGYSQKGLETYERTKSFSNRHKGSGRGFWTGITYYAGPGDPDLRVYSSPEQSIQDFVQLMRDPLYAKAYALAVAGDYKGYFREMARARYSTQSDYELALNNRYRQIQTA